MDDPTRTARAEQSGLLVCDCDTSDIETHTETWRRVCMYSSVRLGVFIHEEKRTGRRGVGRGAAIP